MVKRDYIKIMTILMLVRLEFTYLVDVWCCELGSLVCPW